MTCFRFLDNWMDLFRVAILKCSFHGIASRSRLSNNLFLWAFAKPIKPRGYFLNINSNGIRFKAQPIIHYPQMLILNTTLRLQPKCAIVTIRLLQASEKAWNGNRHFHPLECSDFLRRFSAVGLCWSVWTECGFS